MNNLERMITNAVASYLASVHHQAERAPLTMITKLAEAMGSSSSKTEGPGCDLESRISSLEGRVNTLRDRIIAIEADLYNEDVEDDSSDDDDIDAEYEEADIEDLYDVNEASEYLDIPKQELYEAVRNEEITPYRYGKGFYFSQEDLDAFFDEYYESEEVEEAPADESSDEQRQ